jgi:4'-phosphopantetheinyl transferase EntD
VAWDDRGGPACRIASADAFSDPADVLLFPEEEAIVSAVAEKPGIRDRQKLRPPCARRALAALGVAPAPILPGERAMLRDLAATAPGPCWDRLLFSAKESVYKAWFPPAGRWLRDHGAAAGGALMRMGARNSRA